MIKLSKTRQFIFQSFRLNFKSWESECHLKLRLQFLRYCWKLFIFISFAGSREWIGSVEVGLVIGTFISNKHGNGLTSSMLSLFYTALFSKHRKRQVSGFQKCVLLFLHLQRWRIYWEICSILKIFWRKITFFKVKKRY